MTGPLLWPDSPWRLRHWRVLKRCKIYDKLSLSPSMRLERTGSRRSWLKKPNLRRQRIEVDKTMWDYYSMLAGGAGSRLGRIRNLWHVRKSQCNQRADRRTAGKPGNTSGTGNHVDCLSSIIFSTEMQEAEIEDCLSHYYAFDGWSRYVSKTDDGNYIIYINTLAPFADNIEGH